LPSCFHDNIICNNKYCAFGITKMIKPRKNKPKKT